MTDIEQKISDLEFTAITDFILSGEILFLAGMLSQKSDAAGSAVWWWTLAMFFLGIGALVAGIDHGFYEIHGRKNRLIITKLNWAVLGFATFGVLLTTSERFISENIQPIIFVVGLVQIIIYQFFVWKYSTFLVVIINYLPVMLLMLVFSMLFALENQITWNLPIGVLILLIASAIQAAGIRWRQPVDHNGLYHLISMVGVIFLYFGYVDLI